LPAADQPGAVSFWVRNSSGTQTNLFTVDYWPSGGSEAVILPEVLTEAIVLRQIAVQ
jgi:hypothetical protein